jgi:hypothetical protein
MRIAGRCVAAGRHSAGYLRQLCETGDASARQQREGETIDAERGERGKLSLAVAGVARDRHRIGHLIADQLTMACSQ